MKLMIAVPALDYVHADCVRCLMGLVGRLSAAGIAHEVQFKTGTLVYLAREALTARAIQGTYTHVLWLDADMVFEETIAEKLLESGREFVTGFYCQRRPPFASCAFTRLVPRVERLEGAGTESGADGWAGEDPGRLVRIAGCGFGCALTRVEMLDDVYRHYGKAFTPSEQFGEDLMFCVRAQDRGYELWCDTSVRCGHIGHLIVRPDDAEGLRGAMHLGAV